MINVKRVPRVVFVLACALAIFFGIRAYQQHRHTAAVAVQTYNQWRNQMVGIQNYLYSTGPGEKPRPHGSMSQNPNMALINAESISQSCAALAGEAALILPGQLGSDFSDMAMVSVSFGSELDAMIDHGNYVKGTYEFTQPTRIDIADRDFMYHQLMYTLLAGMPTTVSKAGQINTLYDHLKALNDANSKSFGLFSDSFKKFMYSTGQFR